MRDYHDTVRQLAKGAGAGSTGVVDLLHDASLAGSGRCQDSCRLSSCCQWHTLASSGDRGHDAIPFRVERHGSDG